MKVFYRPRMVIKRYPETLDRDEVGVVCDVEKGEIRLCPPDLSSEDLEELKGRWWRFLLVASEFRNFEFGELWFAVEAQKHAFELARSEFIERFSGSKTEFCKQITGLNLADL